VYGGVGANSVITLSNALPLDGVGSAVSPVICSEAGWLSRNAIENTIGAGDWRSLVNSSAARRRQTTLSAQRTSAGRIALACLLYSRSMQSTDPGKARSLRRIARGFGVIASFLSDGMAVDFLSPARLVSFRRSLTSLVPSCAQDEADPANPELISGLNDAVSSLLDTRYDTMTERPPGNLLPWTRR
jgi:hypothetical protein